MTKRHTGKYHSTSIPVQMSFQRKIYVLLTKLLLFQLFVCRKAVHEAGFSDNQEELDEATNFLHENGLLLHYDEGSVLSDIYFLDPEWLCYNLAKVVTIREDISSHKYGIARCVQVCHERICEWFWLALSPDHSQFNIKR